MASNRGNRLIDFKRPIFMKAISVIPANMYTEKEKIIGSIGYANYDHFLFYNNEKWNEWDFSDINDFFVKK